MKCKLKKIRKKNSITQSDIANKLNIKQNTVSKWENDNAVPNLRLAYELAEYLEVEVTDIWEKKN